MLCETPSADECCAERLPLWMHTERVRDRTKTFRLGGIAVLDCFNPAFSPRNCSRVPEERIAMLCMHGLNEDGEYAIQEAFGAGNISDLTETAVAGIRKGGFRMVQTLPRGDPGLDEVCPYAAGEDGLDPAWADITRIPILGLGEEITDAETMRLVAKRLNERGAELRREGLTEQNRFNHRNLRAFILDMLRIAFERGDSQGPELESFCDQHSDPHDPVLNYAMFAVLRDKFGSEWKKWPDVVGTPGHTNWQLLATVTPEEMHDAFVQIRPIMEETGRALRAAVVDEPMVLAQKRRPGSRHTVRRGEDFLLPLALTKPLPDGTTVRLMTHAPWAEKPNSDGWGTVPVQNGTYRKYEGTDIHEGDFRTEIPPDAAPGEYHFALTVMHADGEHHLTGWDENIVVVVE